MKGECHLCVHFEVKWNVCINICFLSCGVPEWKWHWLYCAAIKMKTKRGYVSNYNSKLILNHSLMFLICGILHCRLESMPGSSSIVPRQSWHAPPGPRPGFPGRSCPFRCPHRTFPQSGLWNPLRGDREVKTIKRGCHSFQQHPAVPQAQSWDTTVRQDHPSVSMAWKKTYFHNFHLSWGFLSQILHAWHWIVVFHEGKGWEILILCCLRVTLQTLHFITILYLFL